MAKQRNILQEAIADTKALKEAAYANAQSVLMEHLKDNVKQFVEQELNEALQTEGSEEESEVSETKLGEGETMAETDELDVEEMPDEESGESDEECADVEEGLTEADLEEALQAALSEVDHGDLGDMELVVNSSSAKKPQGIETVDSKEEGWEEKVAPKAVAPTLGTKEQYHQESRLLKGKIAKLVKENLMLKKANEKISEALQETKLFNAKLFYATKLMQKEGLTNGTKASIVKRMDKVGSLSEAKNLYESLELALGLVKESESARKTPSLTEALGSDGKSVGSGRGVSDAGEQSYVRRNQVLAGMKKE